eukprot:gene10320-8251_t
MGNSPSIQKQLWEAVQKNSCSQLEVSVPGAIGGHDYRVSTGTKGVERFYSLAFAIRTRLVCETLLEHYKHDVDGKREVANIQNKDGKTPLIYAAAKNSQGIAKLLLANSADVHHINPSKSSEGTALHEATKRGHEAMVEVLLQAGADPFVCNSQKRAAIDLAVSEGQANILQRFTPHALGSGSISIKCTTLGGMSQSYKRRYFVVVELSPFTEGEEKGEAQKQLWIFKDSSSSTLRARLTLNGATCSKFGDQGLDGMVRLHPSHARPGGQIWSVNDAGYCILVRPTPPAVATESWTPTESAITSYNLMLVCCNLHESSSLSGLAGQRPVDMPANQSDSPGLLGQRPVAMPVRRLELDRVPSARPTTLSSPHQSASRSPSARLPADSATTPRDGFESRGPPLAPSPSRHLETGSTPREGVALPTPLQQRRSQNGLHGASHMMQHGSPSSYGQQVAGRTSAPSQHPASFVTGPPKLSPSPDLNLSHSKSAPLNLLPLNSAQQQPPEQAAPLVLTPRESAQTQPQAVQYRTHALETQGPDPRIQSSPLNSAQQQLHEQAAPLVLTPRETAQTQPQAVQYRTHALETQGPDPRIASSPLNSAQQQRLLLEGPGQGPLQGALSGRSRDGMESGPLRGGLSANHIGGSPVIQQSSQNHLGGSPARSASAATPRQGVASRSPSARLPADSATTPRDGFVSRGPPLAPSPSRHLETSSTPREGVALPTPLQQRRSQNGLHGASHMMQHGSPSSYGQQVAGRTSAPGQHPASFVTGPPKLSPSPDLNLSHSKSAPLGNVLGGSSAGSNSAGGASTASFSSVGGGQASRDGGRGVTTHLSSTPEHAVQQQGAKSSSTGVGMDAWVGSMQGLPGETDSEFAARIACALNQQGDKNVQDQPTHGAIPKGPDPAVSESPWRNLGFPIDSMGSESLAIVTRGPSHAPPKSKTSNPMLQPPSFMMTSPGREDRKASSALVASHAAANVAVCNGQAGDAGGAGAGGDGRAQGHRVVTVAAAMMVPDYDHGQLKSASHQLTSTMMFPDYENHQLTSAMKVVPTFDKHERVAEASCTPSAPPLHINMDVSQAREVSRQLAVDMSALQSCIADDVILPLPFASLTAFRAIACPSPLKVVPEGEYLVTSEVTTPSGEGVCVICLWAKSNTGFLHGASVHKCVCTGCSKLVPVGAPCPLCREPVERVIGVF